MPVTATNLLIKETIIKSSFRHFTSISVQCTVHTTISNRTLRKPSQIEADLKIVFFH